MYSVSLFLPRCLASGSKSLKGLLRLLHTIWSGARRVRVLASSSSLPLLLTDILFVALSRRYPSVWCRILKNLSLSLPASILYKAMFCTWLLTFHEAFLPQLNDKGTVLAVCLVLKESRVEKVRRKRSRRERDVTTLFLRQREMCIHLHIHAC